MEIVKLMRRKARDICEPDGQQIRTNTQQGPAGTRRRPRHRSTPKPWRTPLKYNEGPVTIEEVRKAVATTSPHRATGPDEIPTEILRSDEAMKSLLPFLSKSVTEGV